MPQEPTWPLDIHRGTKRAHVFRGTANLAAIRLWLRN